MEAFTYRKTMPGTEWLVDITPIYKAMCGENNVKSGRVYYSTELYTAKDIEKIVNELKEKFETSDQQLEFNFDFSKAYYLQIQFNNDSEEGWAGNFVTIGIGKEGTGFEIHS